LPRAAPVYTQDAPASMPPPPPAYQPAAACGADAPPPKGSKYEPITTGGFVGLMLLMCIPILGQILMLVWAFAARKVNKRNFARASLILFAVVLVLGLLLGFVFKSVIDKAIAAFEAETGLDIGAPTVGQGGQPSSGGAEGLAGLLSGLLAAEEDGGEQPAPSGSGSSSAIPSPGESDSADPAEGGDPLSGLSGLLSGLAGMQEGGSDQEELEALGQLLEGLEQMQGGEGEGGGLGDLIDDVQQINQEAEAANYGWPSTLREYPGGTAVPTASYRTEISGTTLEEMLGWIEALKGDGFVYQDFYQFGMTEEEMLGMNGWWATDGEIYLSLSFSDGTVIIDHMNELPDLSSLFGR
ncbi:MAG: hypothetical protein IJC43_06050, partial [Clostridia bacterium]|nr:hypothetical protein [Clostridia bacterium]